MKVGIDLVETKRFKALSENIAHLERLFLPEEIAYIETKRAKNNAINDAKSKPIENTIAGLYAAKEAVLKATNIGVNNIIPFKDVFIEHNNYGAPVVKLLGKAKNWQKENKITKIELSITHDGGFASAICIMQ